MVKGLWPLFGVLLLSGGALCAQPPEPAEIDEWFLEAEDLADRGQDRRALRWLRKVVEAAPRDAEALGLAAGLAANVGEYAQAEEWSARRLELEDTPAARLQRAHLLLLLEEAEDGIALLRPLLAARQPAPRHEPAFSLEAAVLSADFHAMRGRTEEASALHDRVLAEGQRVALRRGDDLVWFARAQEWVALRREARRGGWRLVQQTLKDARTAAEEGEFRPALELARHFESVELPQDAVKTYEEALEERPNLIDALLGLARTYESWGKGARAEAAWARVRRLNPAHPRVVIHRVRKQLGDRDLRAAAKGIAALEDLAPRHRTVLALRATWSLLKGDEEAQQRTLQRLAELAPGQAPGQLEIAETLNQRRRWPEALAACRQATALAPDDPRAWDERGRYAFFLGLDEEGREALERASKRDWVDHVWRVNMRRVADYLQRDFIEIRTEHFIHRVRKDEAEILRPYLVRLGEASYRDLSERYRFRPEGLETAPARILVEHYPDHQSFSVRTLGFTNLGALGVCFGPFIAMDSPAAAEGNAWFRTFHHELAHTITLGISKGRISRWLTEGLSTREELRWEKAWDRGLYRELHAAWATDTLIPLERFEGAFRTSRVLFAYFQGGLVTRWIEERFGWEAVLRLVAAYGDDLSCGQAVQRALGIDAETFDRGFREHVGGLLADVRLVPRLTGLQVRRLEEKLQAGKAAAREAGWLGHALLSRGAVQDAQDVLFSARRAGLAGGELTHLEADLLARAGDATGARRAYERALAAGYDDHDLRVRLAALVAASDPALEREHLEAAIRTFPFRNDAGDPRLTLAERLREAGESERALALLEEHLRWNWKAQEVRRTLLERAREREDRAAMRRHLEAWVLLQPKAVEAHAELAEVALALNAPALAEREAEVLLALVSEQGPQARAKALVLLARARRAQGKNEAAGEAIERARGLAPQLEELRSYESGETKGRSGEAGGEPADRMRAEAAGAMSPRSVGEAGPQGGGES